MNRRNFVATGIAVALAGCTSPGSDPEQNTGSTTTTDEEIVDDPPEEVEEILPLAQSFTEEVDRYFADARVFVNEDAEIAMDYVTSQETQGGLMTEIYQIADLFANVVREKDTTAALSIITGEVEALITEEPLELYANDDLEKSAFQETIQINDVERRD